MSDRIMWLTTEQQDNLEVSLDEWLPGWEEDERRAYGIVISEWDVDMTPDPDEDIDWQAWLEDNYCDPTERGI